jgi:transposase-like protein
MYHKAHYKLADGRYKCKNCGKYFTYRPRYTKLPEEKHKETARLFWLGVPAAAAAKAGGLSAKTVSN